MKILHLSPADNLGEAIGNINEPAVIYLEKGIYRQKVEIAADDVTIIGAGRGESLITYDDYARKIHTDGKEYNTFRTQTLCVTGNNVRLENLTVENSNTRPEEVGQCVALSVHGKFFSAANIDLKSTQDTLFLSPFPDDLVVRYDGFIPRSRLYLEGTSVHLFENCRIYGTVDFVFGCSQAYFKNCELVSLHDSRGFGFIAAPAHPLAEERGFTFIDCEFKNGGVGEGEVFLARPWRDFGKCVFINCKLGKHIAPALFDKWNDTARDKTARFLYYGLDCDFTPAAVPWAKELSGKQANDIINICNKKFTAIKS